ncbi:unnamed protein product (macronuclear) [Paramecium tetraurelia]|uniref:Uncharacterized protein n=1 Tax=Paramecium tetraurelia TaxID=5888 RepID=A0BZ80_PARTE|nr:uncharacterized protein GSPATT00033700001 [Paramecium tetraurelia]CAK63847.1 unnamed protein product [Paramecium tetraurelia]|eukprot:XP_001431245.1 hypothetical protein (macronuclear) [Paramecium tetraurelia strain d4-2]
MDQSANITLKCQINDHNDSINAICYHPYCNEFRFHCFKCTKQGIHRNHMNDVEHIGSLSEFVENQNKQFQNLKDTLNNIIQGLLKSSEILIKGIEEKYYLQKERIMILNLQQLNDYLSSAIKFDEYKQSILPIITEMTKKLDLQFSNLKEQLKLSQITYLIDYQKISAEFYQRGYNLYCSGKFQESIEQLNMSIQLDPSNFLALGCKGACLRLLDKYQDALVCLDQAIEINPKHVNSLSNKGECLRKLGKYEESLIFLNQALQIEHYNTFPIQIKGQCLENLGNYDDAMICYQKFLKYKPGDQRVNSLMENCKQICAQKSKK